MKSFIIVLIVVGSVTIFVNARAMPDAQFEAKHAAAVKAATQIMDKEFAQANMDRLAQNKGRSDLDATANNVRMFLKQLTTLWVTKMIPGWVNHPFYILNGLLNGPSKEDKNLLAVVTAMLKGATNGMVVSHLTGWKDILSTAVAEYSEKNPEHAAEVKKAINEAYNVALAYQKAKNSKGKNNLATAIRNVLRVYEIVLPSWIGKLATGTPKEVGNVLKGTVKGLKTGLSKGDILKAVSSALREGTNELPNVLLRPFYNGMRAGYQN